MLCNAQWWFVGEGSELSTLVSAIGAAFQPGFLEGKQSLPRYW